MLNNEAALYWSACLAARASAQGDDPEKARQAAEEVWAFALNSEYRAIRRGAHATLMALSRASNPAARRVAREALSDLMG